MFISNTDLAVLSPAAREAFLLALRAAEDGDDYPLRVFAALRTYPVSVEQFVTEVLSV